MPAKEAISFYLQQKPLYGDFEVQKRSLGFAFFCDFSAQKNEEKNKSQNEDVVIQRFLLLSATWMTTSAVIIHNSICMHRFNSFIVYKMWFSAARQRWQMLAIHDHASQSCPPLPNDNYY